MSQNLSSAAVVIGALRVKFSSPSTGRYIDLEAGSVSDVFTGYFFTQKYSCFLLFDNTKNLCKTATKNDKTNILMTTGSLNKLMRVEGIAECSQWSILQYA